MDSAGPGPSELKSKTRRVVTILGCLRHEGPLTENILRVKVEEMETMKKKLYAE